MSSNLLNVRIVIEHLKITKMLQFEANLPINEVINQVQAKIQDSIRPNTKAEDYSILRYNPEDEKIGHWLNKQASLSDYSIKQGDELIYKDMNRMVRFKLPDESLKTIIVNETKVLGELLKIICSRAGISNIDEYSLAVESTSQEEKSASGGSQKDNVSGGTLKKKGGSIGITLKKIEEREAKKMEKMKHKLHTDDDVRWVEHDKTLCEQGIDQTEILILRRKYFYESNRNVKDPFEMNILYKQCEESVLKGTLMVTEEEAIQLSALQLQIQKGRVEDSAFKNTIDLKDYLPKEHHKNVKSLEKKIKEQYKTINTLSEPECKQKYTAICQGSKMYGTSIFLVKEKIPGKQKLGPVLLGISKESVMRMDEKSKDTLKIWPLTCIRRWAASPNSFTLDFGEYDENYSVMTSESEQISKLISGYIDLILKKKKVQAAEMATAGVALVEENITPGQGVFMTTASQSDRARVQGIGGRSQVTERVAGSKGQQNNSGVATTSRLYGRGRAERIKQPQVQKFSSPQKALRYKMNQLLVAIPSNDHQIIHNSLEDPMIGKAKSPESYQLMQRQIVGSTLSSMAVIFSTMMNNIQDKDKIDYNSLSNNTVELNEQYLKLLQASDDLALYDPNRDNLEQLLRDFSNNFRNMIGAFSLKEDEIFDIDKKAFTKSYNALSINIRDLTKHFGTNEASDDLMTIINLQTKNLSLAASKIIAEAMKISNECHNKERKDIIEQKILEMKNQLTLITASIPMLSSTLHNDQSLEFFCNQIEELDRRLRLLTQACEEKNNYQDFSHLKKCADDMHNSLQNLINEVRESLANKSKDEINRLLVNIMVLMNASENENLNFDEIKELSKNLTMNLGKVLTILKNDINGETDEKLKHDLFLAARSLADATKVLLDYSKNIQNEDSDIDEIKREQNRTLESIKEILTMNFSNEYDNARALYLKKNLDHLISATILMDSAMQKATESCRSENLENSLWENIDDLSIYLQNLIDSLDELLKNPTSTYRKEDLICRALELCNIGKKSVETSKNAVPLIADFDHAAFLNKAIRAISIAIEDVEKSIGEQEDLSDEMKAQIAKERIREILKEMDKIKSKIDTGTMENFKPENKDVYDAKLMNIYRDMMKIQSQLTDSSYHDDISSLANSLEKLSLLYQKLLGPVYGSAACSQKDEKQKEECKVLIDDLKKIATSTLNCCILAENMYETNNKTLSDDLLAALRLNSDTILKLFDNLPLNKEIESGVHNIEKVNKNHQSKLPGVPTRKDISYADQQKEISHSISSILEQVAEMLRVAYREDVPKFTPIYNSFSENYARTYDHVKSLIVSSNDKNTAKIISESLSGVVNSCNRLTSTVKLFTSDPNPASKVFFSEAAKNFSDELSNMLLKIVSSKPGRQECENIKNGLQFSLRPLLESSDREVLPDKTYSSCVEDIKNVEKNRLNIIEINILTCISSEGSLGDIKSAVEDLGSFINDVIKNTAQSSYLLGMTDGSSTSGRSQVFDEREINKNISEIKKCFESFPVSRKDLKATDVENLKKDIQKYSGNLLLSSKNSVDVLTGNSNIQKELSDVINTLANSVKETINDIKNYESFTNDIQLKTSVDKSKDNILTSAQSLLKLIECEAVKYIPARIGERGKQMQEPVVVDGLRFVESSLATVDLLSSLIDSYDDHTKEEIQNCLGNNKKYLQNLIQTLKSNGPGESLYGELIFRLHQINDDIQVQKEKSLASGKQNVNSSNEFETRFEMFSSKIQEELRELSKLTDKLTHLRAGKLENIVNLFEGIPEAVTVLCSSLANILIEEKNSLFDLLSDIDKELTHSVNSCRINPEDVYGENSKEYNKAINDTIKKFELLSSKINLIAEKSNVLQVVINDIDRINTSLNIAGNSNTKSNITTYQEEKIITECLKSILKESQDLATKSGEKSDIVNARSQNLLKLHEKCSVLIFSNAGKPDSEEINQIRKNYILLGSNLKELLEKVKIIESTSNEIGKQRDLNQQVKKISQNISTILKLIQLSHKGIESCSKMAEMVNDNLSEIETCILFAENKALEKEPDSPTIADLKESTFKCAIEISEQLEDFKKKKDFSDTELLKFSTSLSENAKTLFNNSKKCAISLGVGESDHQIALLNATKSFGTSMGNLLESLKEGPCIESDAGKENIVKSIENTQSSLKDFTRKMESIDEISHQSSAIIDHAVEKIEKMINYLNPNIPCQWDNDTIETKPEDVVRISKDIPFSLAKMTQALNSGKTKDIEDNVKKGEIVFEELIKGVRKFILASNEDTVKSVNECLKKAAISYLALLKNIKNNHANPDMAKIQELSKAATQDIFKFVKTCSDLKSEQFTNMNDPQLLAEKELLSAAASIELAAKKLAELKPRKISTDEPNQELAFDGQILQAVQSIMKATSLLVTHASSAQKELVAKGVLKEKKGGDTGQWSQGLISAARLVAESTHFLCDEAKAAVEGKGSEEKLIAACNSIFSSTSQLIMACKVKADPNSENQARLEKAGGAVKKASKSLVESLKGSGLFSEEKKEVKVDQTQVGGMKQMMEALEEVARREKELVEAREKLIKLRQAKPQ